MAAVGLGIWATMSFAMPAFPVLTSGKGFDSHVIGYVAKMFLLWFALLAFCVGLSSRVAARSSSRWHRGVTFWDAEFCCCCLRRFPKGCGM